MSERICPMCHEPYLKLERYREQGMRLYVHEYVGERPVGCTRLTRSKMKRLERDTRRMRDEVETAQKVKRRV